MKLSKGLAVLLLGVPVLFGVSASFAAVGGPDPDLPTETVKNEVSCKDPKGARSYKEVPKKAQLEYRTIPKDGDELSEEESHVEMRRDVRVDWRITTHSRKLHDWFGLAPFGKRVWVQIVGKLICKTAGGAGGGGAGGAGGGGPEWQSWSVDIDFDADTNNSGEIDPEPRDRFQNTPEEDKLEENKPGAKVDKIKRLVVRQIKPPLPNGSTGEVRIRRNKDRLDIRRDPLDPATSIFPLKDGGPKRENTSIDLFPEVKDKQVVLWMFPLRKEEDLKLEVKLDAKVKFEKRTDKVSFKDKMFLRVKPFSGVQILMRYEDGEILSPVEEFEDPPRKNVEAFANGEILGLLDRDKDLLAIFDHFAEFQGVFLDGTPPGTKFRWRQSRTSRLKILTNTDDFIDGEPPTNDVDDGPELVHQDQTTSNTNRIYTADSPQLSVPPEAPQATVILQRTEFRIWIEKLSGQKISDEYVWHHACTVVKVGVGGGVGNWVRAGFNALGPGPNPNLDPQKIDGSSALKEAVERLENK